METGIIFNNSDPYKVSYVLRQSASDKSSIDLKPGDELVSVNGEMVDKKYRPLLLFHKAISRQRAKAHVQKKWPVIRYKIASAAKHFKRSV